MKLIVVIGMVLFFSAEVSANDITKQAVKYIRYFASGDFKSAANIMACPVDYPIQNLEEDRKANIESLKIFSREFGKVVKAIPTDTSSYITAMTACGDMKFLNENAPFKNVIFEVEYENQGEGFIVLGFSSSSNKPRLVTVSHGLPTLSSGAVEKVRKVIEMIAAK